MAAARSEPTLDASFILVDRISSIIPPFTSVKENILSAKTLPQPSPSLDLPHVHPSQQSTYEPGSHHGYAHDWSTKSTGGLLYIRGNDVIDHYGRVCLPRGVNLSGNCKSPVNDEAISWPDGYRTATFVGRPFPLEEAPEHLSRLRRWGLTFVRFLVTWEAVQPAGPDQYDTEYLTYIRSLLSLFPSYGLLAFVSLHQDVWSRYSGGSGAPAWTLEAVGFDLDALEETGAAWLRGVRGGGRIEAERGIWPCGYQKLAAATMATCFWAGDTFTPKLRIGSKAGEVSVQQFLQTAFLNAWTEIVKAVGGLPGVLGFEMMNEPHRGYVEQKSLHEFVYETDLHLSYVPSAFESFQLGAGHPTTVGHWTRSFPFPTKRTGCGVLNNEGKRVWTTDGPTKGKCIWEMHSVWAWDEMKHTAVVLRENYFRKHPTTGAQVDWYDDFYFPFIKKWSETVRSVVGQEKLIFAEPIPNEFAPESWTVAKRPANMVFAPHWYDLNALFAKAFGEFTVNVQGLSRGMFFLKAFYWGHMSARENFSLQLSNIVKKGREALGGIPVIIGECGIPFDMNKGDAFRTGDWTWQARMMDAMITGLEKAAVSFTLWNYNPDNTDEHGDCWNGENFSWFSRSRASRVADMSPSPDSTPGFAQTDASLDAGGRILSVIVRPYAAKVAGKLLRTAWDPLKGVFEMDFMPGSDVRARETEIFVPSMLTSGRMPVVRGLNQDAGDLCKYREEVQTLFVVHGETLQGRVVRLNVDIGLPAEPPFKLAAYRENFVSITTSLLALTVSVIIMYALL